MKKEETSYGTANGRRKQVILTVSEWSMLYLGILKISSSSSFFLSLLFLLILSPLLLSHAPIYQHLPVLQMYWRNALH